MNNNNLNIAFLGSPEIGAIVLADLIKFGVKISSVITRPDKPKGRGKLPEKTPVKKIAEKNNILIYEPSSKDELTEVISKEKPDICIVAAYGMIISKTALDIPKFGMINFHPSLLPELRGPAPIPASIMCGYEKTGVTIIKVSEEMDAGDILSQEEVELSGEETTPELSKKLAHLGAKMITKLLPGYISGEVKGKKQNDSKATFTKMIKKEDGEVFFQKYQAKNIEQAARAFVPWPSIYFHFKGKKVDFYNITVLSGNFTPGKVEAKNGKIIIGTKKGAVAPEYFKIEGKNKVTASDFVRGYQDFLDTILP